MIEREVKIRIPDLDALRPRLEAMGATRSGAEHELNRILDTADGSLQRRREVLRIRTAGKNTLTWKGRSDENDAYGQKAREELEIEFAAEGAETLMALFAKLGYQESIRYKKERETWRWQGVEIALDHLEFGDFVEVEGDAGVIQDAVRRLGIEHEQQESRSYPELQRLVQSERARSS